jgi:predicted RNA binding protein YcfA (HicA-like mRNA interferase family)
MSKLPALTGKEVIGALEKACFSTIRIRSSHHFMRHSDGRYDQRQK